MSAPSEKALEAAQVGCRAPFERQIARGAAKAAHDPRLGLDRSVCLHDVVEALRRPQTMPGPSTYRLAADFLEREFTDQRGGA